MKFMFDWHSQDSRAAGPLEVANTVTAQYGTGGGNTPIVVHRKCLCRASDNTSAEVVENMATTLKACNVPILAAEVEKCICIQGSMIGRADTNGPQGSGLNNEVSFTLNTIDRHAVAYTFGKTSRPHFKNDAPTYRQLDTANTVNTFHELMNLPCRAYRRTTLCAALCRLSAAGRKGSRTAGAKSNNSRRICRRRPPLFGGAYMQLTALLKESGHRNQFLNGWTSWLRGITACIQIVPSTKCGATVWLCPMRCSL